MEFESRPDLQFLEKHNNMKATELQQQQQQPPSQQSQLPHNILTHCNNNNNNIPGGNMEIANKDSSNILTTPSVSMEMNNGGKSVNSNNTSAPASCVRECASCSQKIWDRFLLHAMDRYWHTGCLKCSCCQAPLGDIGGTCYAKGGMVLCKNDYLRLFGKTGTCSGCGQGIPANEFVMKVQGNSFYHLNCFTCVVCQHRLTSGDRYCFVNGHLLCELDYPKVVKGSIQLPPRVSHSRVGI